MLPAKVIQTGLTMTKRLGLLPFCKASGPHSSTEESQHSIIYKSKQLLDSLVLCQASFQPK